MASWRRIVVGGKSYRWKCGGSVLVQDADGKRVTCVSAAAAKGLTEVEYERGKWKGTSDGMVTPRDVARLIASTVS